MKKLVKIKKRPHLIKSVGIKEFDLKNYYNIFVLRAKENGELSAFEIEAARKVIRRCVKKKGLLLARAYAFLPLMRKPSEVRMGKGKGNRFRKMVYPVSRGQILFQLTKIHGYLAYNALLNASKKLSVCTKVLCYIKKK